MPSNPPSNPPSDPAEPRPDADEWISSQEAARRLGVTTRTLYRFIDQGDLAAYRMGRVIRLRTADLDAFLDAARIRPGTLEHLYPEPSPRDA